MKDDTVTVMQAVFNEAPAGWLHNLAMGMASHIAAIDNDSAAVASYIERHLAPLAALARSEGRTWMMLRDLSRRHTPAAAPPAQSTAEVVDAIVAWLRERTREHWPDPPGTVPGDALDVWSAAAFKSAADHIAATWGKR
jgi:hypothetical protein